MPTSLSPPRAQQVIATAGHVDHGKSSLIRRLTDIDPDRLDEEKRRGLTIDLGFAWCTLPSGLEVGFVDVPGHERFVHNMLAGVGPVRLVLFVVAADEGWKPQTEEHLIILDLLGVDGAVIAVTKADLVDEDHLERTRGAVEQRIHGTALAGARIIAVSSTTGDGIEELRGALDELLAAAPAPATNDRARLFVDRVFTIKGSGTVITGTLSGGPLKVGEDVAALPSGVTARIRGLQTHHHDLDLARPVSRVAINLAGIERTDVARGDAISHPGTWRATTRIDVVLHDVQGLPPLPRRGAYKLYAGSAERDVTLRLLDDDQRFARLRLSSPLVVAAGDRFVLRDSGRRSTIGGGAILDADPPARAGVDASQRLTRRMTALDDHRQLPTLAVAERGAISQGDLKFLFGRDAGPMASQDIVPLRSWWTTRILFEGARTRCVAAVTVFHVDNPLQPGAPLELARTAIADALRRARVRARDIEPLLDVLLDAFIRDGALIRAGNAVHLPTHMPSAGDPRIAAVVARVAAAEPTPPDVRELAASGVARDAFDAAVTSGQLVRVGSDLVFTLAFLTRAEAAIATLPSITVSAFREAMGTTRKYAVPLLEHFDRKGITRREGDVRVLRATPAGPGT